MPDIHFPAKPRRFAPGLRILGTAVIALALVACGQEQQGNSAAPGGGPGGQQQALPVEVAKPLKREAVSWDVFTGRFAAPDEVEIRARVSGYLQSVNFVDGTVVKQGDLLFTIDPRPFQAALAQAEAQLKSAKASVAQTQSDFQRAQALVRQGNASEQVFEQRRQEFQAAEASVDSAEAAVTTAKLDLEYSQIRAPIAGRIGRKMVTEGNLISIGSAESAPLTTIVSTDPIWFYFEVDEQRYIDYRRMLFDGGTATDALPDVEVFVGLSDEPDIARPGKLNFVDNTVDAATGTVQLRATFPNADSFITPGLFGKIRLPASKSFEAVLIPDEAIVADQQRRMAMVVKEDNSIEPRLLKLGPSIFGYRAIAEGLDGSETIVITGLQRARPGAKVAPTMKELEPERGTKGW